ncbi:MAG: Ultraviolet N-glycosylase/AP lyase [Syntrophorhabdus sp. PtaB.Bin184]|jgi:endonuclease-3|nr:MAG: Ultraviolet N-glycosylase/AP lyase [Syntrophorhabdus sp. PtaB.Bin184]
MRKEFPFDEMIAGLTGFFPEESAPIITRISRGETGDPFVVLVGTLLSLRTKDETTEKVMETLIPRARTPRELLGIPDGELERMIYPVGFYRNKAKVLKEVARTIIDRYDGKVPDTIEELLSMRGIGRKTANLVVTEGYGKPGICVDTHVHRISNRLGIVSTKTPHATEDALRRVLPGRYWIVYNSLLVTFGKRICTPLSPKCSECPIANLCARKGVTRSR